METGLPYLFETETEFLGVSPLSIVDDIVNLAHDHVYDVVEELRADIKKIVGDETISDDQLEQVYERCPYRSIKYDDRAFKDSLR